MHNRADTTRSRRTAYRACTLLLLIAPLLPAAKAQALGDKNPYDWAFVHLDYARDEKVEQLRSFCERTHALAQKAAKDEIVLACFDINLKYAEAAKGAAVPDDLTARVSELRASFDSYYIATYLAFYDILFVDRQGAVFYTIRKQCAVGSNLMQADAETSELVRCLKTVPTEEAFVDFHHYAPSSEAAAFFVEPVRDAQGVLIGWIGLQWAINKVNTLFAYTEDLGQTGETFLVNQAGFMLTESNFLGGSTILTKRLDDRNIQAKFAEKQGHRTVTDYRGCSALTAFQVVEFLGTRWLVVAKVDKHQVITQHYAQHRRYFGDRMLRNLAETPLPPLHEHPADIAETTLQVDMDEFLKAEHGERLHTFGVSTCTGFLATYPGKFAYLAHISPKDKVYGADDTNLVGQMIKKVKTFDVYPCDRSRIEFVVVSTHLDSMLAIVDKLIEEKFLLSQIRIIYNPRATSAQIGYDYRNDDLAVSWRTEGLSDTRDTWCMEDARDAEAIIQQIMGLQESATPITAGIDATHNNIATETQEGRPSGA